MRRLPHVRRMRKDAKATLRGLDGSRSRRGTSSCVRIKLPRDLLARSLACISNCAGQPHEDDRLGPPWVGTGREVLNSNAEGYRGSGVGNGGSVEASGESWHGQPASASLRVPSLGTVWLASDGSA